MVPKLPPFLPAAAIILALSTNAVATDADQLQNLIYECAPCHGVDGIAKDVEVPDLAGQHDVYLFNQLKHFKSGKRPHMEMRYMSRHLTEEEMKAIAQYYSNLKR
jgi:cytochrome c553